MSKIRSAFLGSMVLVLSQGAFAETEFQEVRPMIEMCIKGKQCSGDACATILATSDVTKYKFGFKAYKQENQNFGQEVLQCGALFSSSFGSKGFKVPVDNPVKFGVVFGGDDVECRTSGLVVNGLGYIEVRENISVAYHITTNPNACTVTRVQ